MITIRLMGGLGNQLFQWALGLELESRGRNVGFDISHFEGNSSRRYLLGDLGWNLNVTAKNDPITVHEGSLRFNPDLFNVKSPAVLHGYWQSEKYFKKHQNYIRGLIFRSIRVSPTTSATAKEIIAAGEKSCMVHIRRSDNLRLTSTLYHGLTEIDSAFYQKALPMLRERVPGVQFFVFSDDADYLMKMPIDIFNKAGDVPYLVQGNAPSFSVLPDFNIERNPEGREVEDLYLMSLCRHAIIANSTFSWWGAWLGPSDDEFDDERTVVAPDPWFNAGNLDEADIIPETWVKVSTR